MSLAACTLCNGPIVDYEGRETCAEHKVCHACIERWDPEPADPIENWQRLREAYHPSCPKCEAEQVYQGRQFVPGATARRRMAKENFAFLLLAAALVLCVLHAYRDMRRERLYTDVVSVQNRFDTWQPSAAEMRHLTPDEEQTRKNLYAKMGRSRDVVLDSKPRRAGEPIE